MAPGSQIISTLPGEQYAAWSGTSMAAPVVSGIAALVRTKWSDKSQYSSRFIMGQIAATGTPMLGKSERYYQTPDTLAALTTSPEPDLSYMQHWIFDSVDLDPVNDGGMGVVECRGGDH